jgi:hypothetical protein
MNGFGGKKKAKLCLIGFFAWRCGMRWILVVVLLLWCGAASVSAQVGSASERLQFQDALRDPVAADMLNRSTPLAELDAALLAESDRREWSANEDIGRALSHHRAETDRWARDFEEDMRRRTERQNRAFEGELRRSPPASRQ